jgi:hypothetical protein
MPDYYTQFCDKIPKITPAERAWLDAELDRLREGYEDGDGMDHSLDFEHEYYEEKGTTDFVFWSEDGDLSYSLTTLLSRFLADNRPGEYIAISFASTCSRTTIDAFGGGMVFITADGCEGDPQQQWFSQKVKEFEEAHPKPPELAGGENHATL